MDDKEKGIVETAIEAVKDIAHTASEAAKHAMGPEALKPGDKVVAVPMVADGMMGMTPPFVVVRRKKTPKKTAKTTTKRAAKTIAKKSAKKSAAKKWKLPAKAAKKNAGKNAVKKKKTKQSK